MAKLIVHLDAPVAFELKPGSNFLGRAESNDIQINHPTISGQHCEIIYNYGHVKIKDLNSTNGIYYNKVRVSEVDLKHGEVVYVGAVPIEVELVPVVSVPQMAITQPVSPNFFIGGWPACSEHRMRKAEWWCPKCEKHYCDECVHKIRRVGGVALILCPSCSSKCDPIMPEKEEVRSTFSKIKAFFDKVLGKSG